MELEIEVEKLGDLHRVSQVVNVDLDLNHGPDTKMGGGVSIQGFAVCPRGTPV